MKKLLSLLIVFTLILSFAGCEEKNFDKNQNEAQDISQDVTINYNSLEELLNSINEDFTATSGDLTKELETVHSKIGGTFAGYTENQQEISDWYNLVKSESGKLYERTIKNAVEYYKLIAKTIDRNDFNAIEDVLDDFEDAIYEDAFDDYEEAIYEDAFDDLENTYYDGIIDDAKGTMSYSDWYDISSDFYSDWYDARSDFYSDWYDARSNFYSDWYDVKWEFYDNNFDIDDILNIKTNIESDNKEADTTSKETQTPAETEPSTESEQPKESTSSTIEWREFLQEYEKWVDDYIEFLNKYKENPYDLSILLDYTDMVTQLAEWAEKTEAMQAELEDVSPAELVEYSAELLRIAGKIAQAAY